MPRASATGAEASGGAARQREHNQGNQDRTFTVEQKAAVLRIRKCRPTDFYDILELESVRRTCSDADVKKAYRKQSLLTHPDKNGHPHAAEAFKMVARAFSILGDKEKREKYDRSGTDPDSRFERARQDGPFAGFANRAAAAGGRGTWEEEISPEEMFARFFGGGFGDGGPFGGGGPQFAFNFGGGPGIRVHQFGGARPRARPRNPDEAREQNIWTTILSMLPILLLFVLPLLSSLFSEDGMSSTPQMAFEHPLPPALVLERNMPRLGVKYYVNPHEVKSYSPSKLSVLDRKAEVALINRLNSACEQERGQQQRLVDEARGWFGQDAVKMEAARNYKMPNCKKLQALGLGR